MKILQPAGGTGTTVLLFGLGLIGAAADRALQLQRPGLARVLPYDWNDGGLRQVQVGAIRAALPHDGRLALVWAGGKSGFGATDADMAQETVLVAELVVMAEDLAKTGRQVEFHLMSSAGGLFESQTHCDRLSLPRPLRPYGEGKRRQEAILLEAQGLASRRIYRPSSVYGLSRSPRVGLITALIHGALRGGTTRIFGNPNTLRDYVLADDIGRYLAGRILDPGLAPDEVLLLANGRPASVFEVIARIQDRMDRPLLLQFDPHPSNGRDMSFMPSALPTDWRATSLTSGIASIVTFLRSGSA